jgi:hypothetical protein
MTGDFLIMGGTNLLALAAFLAIWDWRAGR